MKTMKHISMLLVFSISAAATHATEYTAPITANGTAVTLNSGDTVSTANISGNTGTLNASNSGSITGTNLTLTVAESARIAVYILSGGTVSVGTDTVINHNGDKEGVYAANGSFYATSGLKVISSTSSGTGVSFNNSTVDLGTNGVIESGRLGMNIGDGTSFRMDSFTLKAPVYNAIQLSNGQTDTYIRNSTITAGNIGVVITSDTSVASRKGDATDIFDNTSIHAGNYALTHANSAAGANAVSRTVSFVNGSKVSSDSGILLYGLSTTYAGSVEVVFSGSGTVGSGRVVRDKDIDTKLTFKDGATWDKVTGDNAIRSLEFDGANVNFTFSSASDSVQAAILTFGANKSEINIGLTEEFAALYFHDPLGEFIFSIQDTITGNTADGFGESANINIAGSSGAYSWLSEYLGEGKYRLYNFIPEASTYAAIFGVFALGFAVFRKRK